MQEDHLVCVGASCGETCLFTVVVVVDDDGGGDKFDAPCERR